MNPRPTSLRPFQLRPEDQLRSRGLRCPMPGSMHNHVKNILLISCLLASLASGCRTQTLNQGAISDNIVEFARSSRNHRADLNRLQTELKANDIDCSEGWLSRGKISLFVATPQFTKAKDLAVAYIVQTSLTIRLKKAEAGDVYEIYSNGKRLSEETYVAGRRKE